jgi:hypothetical protein
MPQALCESWDNVSHYDYDDITLDYYNYITNSISDLITEHFSTTTYIFITAEKNKKGIMHLHLLIGIRNFMDYNYTLKNNLSLALKFYVAGTGISVSPCDIKVDSLLYFKDIKNWGMYIFKDKFKWRLPAKLLMLDIYKDSNFYNHLHFNFTCRIELKIEQELFRSSNEKSNIMVGIKLIHNKLSREVLLDILQYYLVLNNYFIYKDDIYEKVEGYSISYKLIGGVKKTLYDYFHKNVINFFVLNYSHYFEGFDFQYLLKKYFLKHKTDILKLGEISTQRINPDFSLMEFTDGIYSIKYDRFFPKSDHKPFSENISTVKYYNKTFLHVRRDKPKIWINGLRNALGVTGNIENNKDFINICLYLVNILHKDVFTKKSTLFVYGMSNSGKTTYLVKPIEHYLGNENIGSVTSSKNFKYQDLEDKLVGVMDEGRYNPSMSSDLLKIMGKENIKVDKKFSDHISINPVPLFILSNEMFRDKNPSLDKALKNRMYIIEFINEVLQNNMNFSQLLKDENVNILVFANKLFFKLKMGNRIGSRISNDKIIKMIEDKS